MDEEIQQKQSIVKQLRAQKQHHETKVIYWRQQKKDIDKNLDKHEHQLAAVNKKLEKIEGREIWLTTHMIKRWQERVGPGTEQEIRDRILTPDTEKLIRTLGGACKIPIAYTSLVIVVEDYKLLTIYSDESKWKLNKAKIKGRKRNNRQKPIDDGAE